MDFRKQWSKKYVGRHASVSRIIVGSVFASSTVVAASLGNKLSADQRALLAQQRTEAALAANSKAVVLVGMTGRGKSAFGNLLTGTSHFLENQGAISTQLPIAINSGECGTGCVTVIETAGINDSRGKDFANITTVVEQLMASPVQKIDAVLLVTKYHDVRFDAADKRLLRLYDHVFDGSNFWRDNFALVFTHSGKVPIREAHRLKTTNSEQAYMTQLKRFLKQELNLKTTPPAFFVDSKNRDYGDFDKLVSWVQSMPDTSALPKEKLRIPTDERCWRLAEPTERNFWKGKVVKVETQTTEHIAPLRSAGSWTVGVACLAGMMFPPISPVMYDEFKKRLHVSRFKVEEIVEYKEDLRRDIWIGFDGQTQYEAEWKPVKTYQEIVSSKKTFY